MGDYVSITKDTLVEKTKIGCDLYLKSYINGAPKYVLFCRGNEQFESERREELLEKNVQRLFILSKDYKEYFKYQEKNLPQIISNSNLSTQEKSHAVYHVAKNITKDILKDARTGVNVKRVENWVKYTVSYILNDKNAFAGLLNVTSYDYYTYTHSVNLSVFGLLFGKHLFLTPDDLNAFGTGMLLHDIGKIEIPLEIINKPGKLTKDEFETIKKHPETGVAFLKAKNIKEKSLIPVIQHHENYDGTGYPYEIGGNEIDIFGKLSRIIDVYDAITTKRSYANAMRPFAALKVMKEKMISCFDVELFQEFICFLGPTDPRKHTRSGDLVPLVS
ncbi:MAG: hypothetical protein SCARUB_02417 [Candidatus Scalindua rubra]|uniref:HD-GYP domain-containing protein n=1 Tax=Candidatus Scalindua rubra TaxID=1872076 RepID=A0A1E3XA32_9BACT|nr:MAG: hypothetical protein SCARUB_02417 [Candidatus Scalindua rubra]